MNSLIQRRIVSAFLIATALYAEGCTSDGAGNAEETEPGNNGDTGTDMSGSNATTAFASFCNPIAYNNGSAVLSLVIGENEHQVTLSASTGTCSNRLGETCAEIPQGEAVSASLQSEAGETLYTTQLSIESGADHVLFASLDAEANVILQSGILNESLDCANMECYRSAYNELTCAEDDPCGWVGNGRCDDYCLDAVPSGSAVFDDTADCAE